MYKQYQCDCPVPCDTTTFKPVLSYAAYPSNSLIPSAVKIVHPDIVNLTPEIIRYVKEHMRYVYITPPPPPLTEEQLQRNRKQQK